MPSNPVLIVAGEEFKNAALPIMSSGYANDSVGVNVYPSPEFPMDTEETDPPTPKTAVKTGGTVAGGSLNVTIG
jgi:hypothetical protein